MPMGQEEESPSTSVVKENVLTLYCCEVPEMLCGLQIVIQTFIPS